MYTARFWRCKNYSHIFFFFAKIPWNQWCTYCFHEIFLLMKVVFLHCTMNHSAWIRFFLYISRKKLISFWQKKITIIWLISGTGKRKKSWTRAVFSHLQRKGLEKRFQMQKYITKPDRRQLAASLGLTDAQVPNPLINGNSTSITITRKNGIFFHWIWIELSTKKQCTTQCCKKAFFKNSRISNCKIHLISFCR